MHATQPPPDPVDNTTVSPVTALRSAADYLDQHGWIQSEYYHCDDCEQPAACTLGALAIACYGHPIADPFDDLSDEGRNIVDLDHLNRWHDFMTVHHALMYCLNLGWDRLELSVDVWNDTTGRTATEVTTTLRAAADHLASAERRVAP